MNANDNRDLRISLMIGDLSEDEFKKKIQQREKARQRKTDIRQVIEMLRAVLLDLFQDFAQTKNTDTLHLSLCELQKHYNDTLLAVSKRYSKCAIPLLTGNFSTP
jgi:hydrogenase maturation factor HypF (carbamoyltransferase family)